MDATLGTLRPWLIGGLAAYSLCLTLLTSWFVARLWGSRRLAPSVLDVLGQLVWAALVFAAGWLTIRYAERLTYPALGYVTGIVLTTVLSIVRAVLSQAAPHSQSRGGRSWQVLARCLLHELTYVMTAIAACLLVSILFRARVDPRLFIPLAIGAVLPGLLPRARPEDPASQPAGQGATKVSLRAAKMAGR